MPLSISIITPCRNHARYLVPTMDSVLAADHGMLEYGIVDGGSTDDSVEVLRRYEDRLAFWISEPDGGLYDAINKGFARSTGEIMGWLNASDLYFPDCLRIVSDIFTEFPEVEWLTSRVVSTCDEHGRCIRQELNAGFERQAFRRGENLPGFGWPAIGFVPQESTFWRRKLWERAGGRLDTRYRYAAEFELWSRFFRETRLCAVDAPLGTFRRHGDQISRTCHQAYQHEARKVLAEAGGKPRTAAVGAFQVVMRRALPRVLRPVAHKAGVLRPAWICEYDFARKRWALGDY